MSDLLNKKSIYIDRVIDKSVKDIDLLINQIKELYLHNQEVDNRLFNIERCLTKILNEIKKDNTEK